MSDIPGFHCSEVPYSRNSMQGDNQGDRRDR